MPVAISAILIRTESSKHIKVSALILAIKLGSTIIFKVSLAIQLLLSETEII